MKKSFFVKAVSLIVVLIIAFSSAFTASAAPENTSKIEKVKKTYDIAVVFDNSGSMYMRSYTRWSQAKYAMEIFASMLDYQDGKGDKLTIYTMWPVCIDGSTNGKTTYKVEISDEKDIDKIKNMYTVYDKLPDGDYNNGTPYETVEEAYSGLRSNNKADEEWLVVLTDGQFGSEKRIGSDIAWDRSRPLQQRLEEYTKSGIKVQYIGLDMSEPVDPEEKKDYETQKVKSNGDFYVAKAVTGSNADIKTVLIDVCNKIFQRNELKDGLNKNKLTLDISMSKIIVFVQGDNDKAPVLKNSKGDVIPAYLDSGLRQYNYLSCNQKFDAKIKADETLFGQVVTFSDLDKGNYTLEYPGSQDQVKIFYEPDVDIKIDFYGKFGDNEEEKITQDTEVLYPGKYRVVYSVVDRKYREVDVTKSPLMGENGVTDLKCIVEITNGDKTTEVPVESGKEITLGAGDTVFFNVSGTYLKDYRITTEDNKDGFTFNISQFPKPLELEVDVDVEQDGDWYQVSKRDEWKPINVAVTYDDKPLTDDEMAKVTPTFTFSPEVAYTYEMLPGKSAFAVYIGKDKNGKDVEIEDGVYEITADVTFKDEYDRVIETEDPDDDKFEVQKYSKLVRILLIVLPILALIALILFIMSRKALPKDLIAERREFLIRGRNAGNGSYTYDRKGRSLQVSTPPIEDVEAACGVTFSLYPVDRRWTPSRKRKIGIKDISARGLNVSRVRIDGTAYEKDAKGRYVQKLSPDDPIKEESSNPDIRVETRKSSLEYSFTSN